MNNLNSLLFSIFLLLSYSSQSNNTKTQEKSHLFDTFNQFDDTGINLHSKPDDLLTCESKDGPQIPLQNNKKISEIDENNKKSELKGDTKPANTFQKVPCCSINVDGIKKALDPKDDETTFHMTSEILAGFFFFVCTGFYKQSKSLMPYFFINKNGEFRTKFFQRIALSSHAFKDRKNKRASQLEEAIKNIKK